MIKKLFFIWVLIITLISTGFGADSLTCLIRDGTGCQGNEIALLYANGNSDFQDAAGRVLSSNSAIAFSSNYNQTVCCKSNLGAGNLTADFIDETVSCPSVAGRSTVDLIHFTSPDINSRIGFRDVSIDSHTTIPTTHIFNSAHYSKKLCISIPDIFSSFYLKVSDRDLSSAGYECMFKVSSLINGVVSGCDSTFNEGDQYDYTVWGKLTEKTSTLVCNKDCTSKLDNRVYNACGEKLAQCQGIPEACDGSLLGNWVLFNETHEVKCEGPWNVYRPRTFSEIQLQVTSTSKDCEGSLINVKYPILIDNEVTNLRVFICSEK